MSAHLYADLVDLRWAIVVPAYLLGTFPSALLVGRSVGRDPTREGSGNPGASNAYRTMGRSAGVLVLVGDVVKGAAAAGVGLATGSRGVAVACGLAAVVGHVLPVTRRLRGGKGVATAAGMTMVLLPLPALFLATGWAVLAKATRTASVASIAVVVALPIAAALAARPLGEVAAFAACSVLVVARHRDNIDRLMHGEERPLSHTTPDPPEV